MWNGWSRYRVSFGIAGELEWTYYGLTSGEPAEGKYEYWGDPPYTLVHLDQRSSTGVRRNPSEY